MEIFAKIERIDAQIEAMEKLAKLDAEKVRTEAEQDAGQRVLANLDPAERERQQAYSAAFRNFVVHGERGISNEEAGLLRTGFRNAQSGQQANGAQGGYLVPTGWGGELLEALKSFGGMRDVARVIQTASGNPIPWPTVDDTASEGEIVPENIAASTADFTFGTTSIGAWKWSSKIFTVPIELLMDQGPGVDIEAYIRKSAAMRIARGQNRKYTVGAGTTEPLGIVNSAVAGKVGLTGQTTSLISDDLVDLEHSVDPAYRSGPGVGWMFADSTLRFIKKLKDNMNRPLWLPGYDEGARYDPGYRYTINQHMPAMAANAKSMLFGKLDEYLIRDVLDVTLFRFDDSNFVTKGQIGFLAWARGDGKLITGGQPIAYYQNSAT
jgi:HK97 family phage major capsid protein